MVVEHASGDITLKGQSHTLRACEVGGEQWVGLIHIDSPTDGAMLLPEDALALRDWLNQRLWVYADIDRPEHDQSDCTKFGETNPADYCRECFIERYGLTHVQRQEA